MGFSEILNKRSEEIERPKPLPVGTYLMMIPAPAEIKQIGKNNTDAAEFQCRVVQAMDDVDASALEAAGGIQNKTMRLTFWLTEEAAFRLKEFLINALEVDENGRTLGEMMPDAVNRMFKAQIKHRPSPDGTQIYAEIGQTAKAD